MHYPYPEPGSYSDQLRSGSDSDPEQVNIVSGWCTCMACTGARSSKPHKRCKKSGSTSTFLQIKRVCVCTAGTRARMSQGTILKLLIYF